MRAEAGGDVDGGAGEGGDGPGPATFLNELAEDRAREALLRCCASSRWANRMLELRPFRDDDHLFRAADRVWRDLGPDDWLEAFAAHPRIGEPPEGDGEEEAREEATEWSRDEQSGMDSASPDLEVRMARLNREYEERFGHVFLIFASGKSGEEMLRHLVERMENDPETELRVAAEEQRKITRLRLEKLAESEEGGV